jgi:myo-inositol-1-phosphate synthase
LSGKVRVAIIGVGNCASSFVQGVQYYRNAKANEFVPGLMHVNLGGYHISDIEFTCAFERTSPKRSGRVKTAPSSSATFPRWASRSTGA